MQTIKRKIYKLIEVMKKIILAKQENRYTLYVDYIAFSANHILIEYTSAG